MPRPEPKSPARSLAVPATRELSDSKPKARLVRSARSKHWQPPEGFSPDALRAVIAAASGDRDRRLLRVLWATGARISEVLALRPIHVQRDSLVLANRKNPNLTAKRVFLPASELGLTGELAKRRVAQWGAVPGAPRCAWQCRCLSRCSRQPHL